jgi:hypothetical protein
VDLEVSSFENHVSPDESAPRLVVKCDVLLSACMLVRLIILVHALTQTQTQSKDHMKCHYFCKQYIHDRTHCPPEQWRHNVGTGATNNQETEIQNTRHVQVETEMQKAHVTTLSPQLFSKQIALHSNDTTALK